jgi:hypothetical protein
MKILYELTNQVSRQRKIIESLLPADSKSPLRKLYTILLRENKFTEAECMNEIYGKRNITAFSRLKTRLRDVLLQAIILQINTNNFSDVRSNVHLQVAMQSLVGKSLRIRKLEWIAAELLEKTLPKALKYSITEDVLIQTRQLLNYYSSHSKNNKYKSKKYHELQKKYFYIYEWESRAEFYYLDIQNTQFQSLANASEVTKRKSLKYYQELEKINDIHTFRFRFNRYRIFASYFEFTKDYNSLLSLTEQTLKEFSSKEFSSETNINNIQIRNLWALIQAGRLEDTINVGHKALNKVSSDEVNWFRINYYILKAHLYSKKYNKAVDLIYRIINNPKFPKINEYYHEIFFTTLGYVHLLVESGLAGDPKDIIKKLPDFKLGKFLNTIPVFSKDKRGINVSILIMHIAFLLQRKDFNAIIDRTDSLNQYAYRYLRHDDSFRSNCMIKMVIQMTKADFNLVRTERYTADLLKQLSSVDLAGSGENIEIEIIPFEVLWDIMVKSL